MMRVCILIAISVLAGCQFKGEPPPEGGSAGASDSRDFWTPRPVAVRVYPTTRFVRDGDGAALEARIELFDEMGDSIKGSGEFFLELREGPTATADTLLYSWRVQVRTLEDHRRYYDPVTRTYLFHLKLDSMAVARRSTLLAVSYTASSGRRYTAEAPIRTDW